MTVNTYAFRDDFWHDKMQGDVAKDQERLTHLRVRYEDSEASKRGRPVTFRKPYYFSSGTSSSLVVA